MRWAQKQQLITSNSACSLADVASASLLDLERGRIDIADNLELSQHLLISRRKLPIFFLLLLYHIGNGFRGLAFLFLQWGIVILQFFDSHIKFVRKFLLQSSIISLSFSFKRRTLASSFLFVKSKRFSNFLWANSHSCLINRRETRKLTTLIFLRCSSLSASNSEIRVYD